MTDEFSGIGPGPAILSAEAIMSFDSEAMTVLHDTIGWRGLGYSSIQLSIDMLNRFGAANNERGLHLVRRISDERIGKAAKLVLAASGDISHRRVADYGSQFLRTSVLEPLESQSESERIIIEEPFPGEERELLLGIAIVNLILIGIATNVERYDGDADATPQSTIDAYRLRLPDRYSASIAR